MSETSDSEVASLECGSGRRGVEYVGNLSLKLIVENDVGGGALGTGGSTLKTLNKGVDPKLFMLTMLWSLMQKFSYWHNMSQLLFFDLRMLC